MDEFFWMIFGVLLTMALTALGYVISARREHKRWIRSERLQIYTAALRTNGAADVMLWTRSTMQETIDEKKAKIESKLSELNVEADAKESKVNTERSEHLRSVLEEFFPSGFNAELLTLYREQAHINAVMELVAPDSTVQAFQEYTEVSAEPTTSQEEKDQAWFKFRSRCQKDLKIGRE